MLIFLLDINGYYCRIIAGYLSVVDPSLDGKNEDPMSYPINRSYIDHVLMGKPMPSQLGYLT